jgi:hypothetical protein
MWTSAAPNIDNNAESMLNDNEKYTSILKYCSIVSKFNT